jgi:tetratricopeptide (TPR) repeat protein
MRQLLIGTVLASIGVITHSTNAPAQYSKEVLTRPNANVTLGPYLASMMSHSAVNSSTFSRNWTNGHHGHWHGRGHIHYHAAVPSYVYPYVTAYPYVGGNPYAYGYWPYYLDAGTGPLGPYVAPPLYVPPEELGFGPQAVRRFMGLDAVQPVIVNRNVVVAAPAAHGDAPRDANDRGEPRAGRQIRFSNAEARDRAAQYIEFGDAHFRERRLADAYDRYKKAAEAAPDLSEPYFRQGHTLAALRRYEQAAAAFRRGMALRPDWPAGGFRLSEIYHDRDAARLATLDTLQRIAEAQPGDVNVQFTAGVQFFFDGQVEQAKKYFERAKALDEPAQNVDPFLKPLRVPDAQVEVDI